MLITDGSGGLSDETTAPFTFLLSNPTLYAFNDLAGEASDTTTFAFGMPIFYGRSIFTAIEGRSTPAGTGPFNAF